MKLTAMLLSVVTIIAKFLMILTGNQSTTQSTLVRMTANGPVQGIEQTSALGQKYYSFRGVPFAAPPITGIDPYTGQTVDRRFKAPEPLEYVWTEPLKAFNFSKVCMQQFMNISYLSSNEKSEDCLFLNIYVPADGAQKKTVLVFIHGGSFVHGNARDAVYGPDFLLSQDNVVVTIQYRLGMFGFLNLDQEPYTGNMGLKDQQMALKWIHANIGHFSGRNDQILLFGQSVGGSSVHFQMLNPESRKYFQRAFILSGTALVFSTLRKQNQLQEVQECLKTNVDAELIHYLKTANASVLTQCYALKGIEFFRSIWVPTVENSSVCGAFLTKTPEEVYESNEAPVMDTMFSMAKTEMLALDINYFNLTDPSKILKENWRALSLQTPCRTNTIPSPGHRKDLTLLSEVYFSAKNDCVTFKQKNLQFVTDFVFSYATVKSTILQTRANFNCAAEDERKKTFLFRFDVNAGLNLIEAILHTNYSGATHMDDVGYLFYCRALDQLNLYDRALEQKDLSYDIIMRSVKMITNFARTGDPSIDANTHLTPCNPNQVYHAEVTNEMKTVVKTDIKDQIHYDTWAQAENIFNAFDCYPGYYEEEN